MLEYWFGQVGYDEVLNHQIKQESDERVTGVKCEIVDFRDADFTLSDSNILNVSESLSRKFRSKKVALVIDQKDWERANLYSKSAWQVDVDVLAFYTLEAACAWIGYDCIQIEKKFKQLKAGLIAELA